MRNKILALLGAVALLMGVGVTTARADTFTWYGQHCVNAGYDTYVYADTQVVASGAARVVKIQTGGGNMKVVSIDLTIQGDSGGGSGIGTFRPGTAAVWQSPGSFTWTPWENPGNTWAQVYYHVHSNGVISDCWGNFQYRT